MKHTFVTVLHHEDRGLQRLQARSFAHYLSPELVAEILIIENNTPGQPTGWSEGLRGEYGRLADLVRTVEAATIVELPPWASGWFSQQILKLMASRLVTTERCVLLDAKNHLAFPMAKDFLVIGGKMRSRWVNYRGHPLERFFERTLRYFGLDPKTHRAAFLPTTTPFTLLTRIARAVVAHVERRERCPFPDAFLQRGLTEFFAVGAFIVASGERLDELYDFSSAPCPTIWEETVALGREAVAATIALAEKEGHPFFCLHRRAIPKLTAEDCRKISAFWQRRGLFETASEGLIFLTAKRESDKKWGKTITSEHFQSEQRINANET